MESVESDLRTPLLPPCSFAGFAWNGARFYGVRECDDGRRRSFEESALCYGDFGWGCGADLCAVYGPLDAAADGAEVRNPIELVHEHSDAPVIGVVGDASGLHRCALVWSVP